MFETVIHFGLGLERWSL